MTYLAHRRTSIKADIIEFTAVAAASLAVGTTYSQTNTPTKTSATISGGYIVLNSGSNWRLEVSISSSYYFSSSSSSNLLEVQWWDGTSYYGNRGETSETLSVVACRNSATVFIPASSITGTLSLIPRVSALGGSLADQSTSLVPSPTVKILELPT